jgi:hypothetical protein
MIHFNFTGSEQDHIQLRRMFNDYFERGVHVTRLKPRDMPPLWIEKIEKHLVHYKPLLKDKEKHMQSAWDNGKINPYQASKFMYLYEELLHNEPWFPSQGWYTQDEERILTHPGIVKSRVQLDLNSGYIDLWNTQGTSYDHPMTYNEWISEYTLGDGTDIHHYEVTTDKYTGEDFIEMFPHWDNTKSINAPYREFQDRWRNTLTKFKYGKERTLDQIDQMNYRIQNLRHEEKEVIHEFDTKET